MCMSIKAGCKLGQEIKIRGLHLSNDFQGAWNKFTVDMALPNSRFEHYMKMDPHQLKKNFKIMLTNSATRTARGNSAGLGTKSTSLLLHNYLN
mmetsp:Transcript_23414/g.47047  ORF Transcript_23414/g.47047 Transcript_23414/m.47047 type:complete len:93 (-) Transcript_23414:266-544(-)